MVLKDPAYVLFGAVGLSDEERNRITKRGVSYDCRPAYTASRKRQTLALVQGANCTRHADACPTSKVHSFAWPVPQHRFQHPSSFHWKLWKP